MTDPDHSDRVRLVIELPRFDLPVLGLAFTYAEVVMQERAPEPAARLTTYISDQVSLAFSDVDADDVRDMSTREMAKAVIRSMHGAMSGADADTATEWDLDKRVSVRIEEIDDE